MHDSSTKERATSLRRAGKSYSEILKEVRVAKSTLSEWLKDVGLSKSQKQLFTEKRRLGALRGAYRRREIRLNTQANIIGIAQKEIGRMSDYQLKIIGTCLYWAEGAKEKEYNAGSGVKFSNSDWKMVRVFQKFLYDVCGVSEQDIKYELYIHDTRRQDVEKIRIFWSNRLKLDRNRITHIYFKPGKVKTKRHNTGDDYVGLVRVCVKKSSTLVRRIVGWTEGIYKSYCGVV